MSDLGANPELDTAFRDRGRIVAIALQKLARSTMTNEAAVLQIRGYGYAQAKLKLPADLMQGVGLPEIDIPVRFIVQDDPNIGAMYIPSRYVGGVGRIQLPILPNADWFSIYRALHSTDMRMNAAAQRHLTAFQEQIDSWFEHRKTYVVHEMTHMFDFLRIKNDLPIVSAQVHGRAAYINNPIELNAHFQEMLAEVEERIPQLPHVAQDAAIGDFDAFWGVARRTRAYIDVWEHLTPKNQRRFYTRAFQYWKSVQPQETAEQRREPVRFPDLRRRDVQEYARREAPRESIFERIQRDIEARRDRRRR